MSGLTVRFKLGPRGPGPSPGGGARRPRRQPRQRRPRQPTRRNGDRTARLLALAHHIDRLIEDGRLLDYAEAADVLGLTRARITQVMNLLLLAPGIQAGIAVGETAVPERSLRCISAEAEWEKQLVLIEKDES